MAKNPDVIEWRVDYFEAIADTAAVLETGRAMLRRAFDRGVTHFDLANNYGPPYGSAEETFGRVVASDLRPYRDELIVSTKAGDLEVAIPKLRKGSFFPEVLERRRRVDQALYAVIMEAYVNGVSTRSVDNLVAAMGVEAGSPSRRCRGSVSGSTNASQRSVVAPSATSGSRTSISMPPTSMSVTTPWVRSSPVRL